MERRYKIYLDVCCLNRPLDDWLQPRIRLEAEAVLAILSRCQLNEWEFVSSTALESEILQTPDAVKRQRVFMSLEIAQVSVTITEAMFQRSKALTALGFKPFDALHIACAESANVDVMLTTDDRLLRKAQKEASLLQVQVENPVMWLMKVSVTEEEDTANDSN